MTSINTPISHDRIATPTSTGKLLWLGLWFGESEDQSDCFLSVKENGVQAYWSVTDTLARIDDFSEAAQMRILAVCECNPPT